MAHPDEISKVASVQKKVNDVKGVMMENIERVLERGEKIELLVDKTDALHNQAEQFQRKGKQLRRAMCWQNWKWKILTISIIIVLIIVIFLIACFSGGNCTSNEPVTAPPVPATLSPSPLPDPSPQPVP